MKIFLLVLLVLLLLTLLICLTQIVAKLSLQDGTFTWEVRYFGIRLLPRPKRNKPGSDRKAKKRKKEALPEDGKPLRKKLLMDKLWNTMQHLAEKCDLIGSGLAALPKPVQLFFRGVTWSDIAADIVIGGEDAAQTAKQYGIVQAGVQTLVSASAHVVRVKRGEMHIGCDFTADHSRWNFRCKIKVRMGAMMLAGIWLLCSFLKDRRTAEKQFVSDVL